MEDELQLRVQMLTAGIWEAFVVLLGASGWIVATWQHPHRGALVAITVAGAAATAIIAGLPRARILASRQGDWFCFGWSLSLVAFIVVAADLDAGTRSPLLLLLFITLGYTSLTYPGWAVATLTGVSLLSVLALWRFGAESVVAPDDSQYLWALMASLAMSGGMCIYQARLQERARGRLSEASRRDPLTGCLNRLGFTERLDHELARTAHTGQPLALVVLDFDGFKQVNDRRGHAAGDELLRWAASTMTGVLRPSDELGRMGGDEFSVLLPGLTAAQAQPITDRLRSALAERITASAGVSDTLRAGRDLDILHSDADAGLYAVKRGRASLTAGIRG